jgi:hypothetical protein
MVEAEKAKKIAKKPKKIKLIRRYCMDGEYIVQLNLPNFNLADLELQQCPTCFCICGSGVEPWDMSFPVETDMGDESFKWEYSEEGVLTLKFGLAAGRACKKRRLK